MLFSFNSTFSLPMGLTPYLPIDIIGDRDTNTTGLWGETVMPGEMTTDIELTQERLKSLLNYNPETGEFTRLVSRRSYQAGEIAGCLKRDRSEKVYIIIKIDGKNYRAHRLVWLYSYGKWPKNDIDHIDQDSTNNRLINLRDVSHAENGKNRKMSKRNNSGVTGVCFHNKAQKWMARIKVNGKGIYLGYFELKDDAITARKNADVEYGFHPNHGN
jgi:hypothetical protein